MNLTPFVDKTTGKVTSNTREITVDPRTGVCLVNAPAAQGATGFLAKAGKIELGALTIESRTVFATVLAVALDSKPLAIS